MKKVVKSLLASMMLASCITFIPANASSTNLALNKTASASSFEVDSTNASKAVDGNENTWWGTGQNKASGEWINVNLGGEQTVRQIKLLFEREDAGQNILGYTVSLKVNGEYQNVYSKTSKAKKEEVIQLDQDYTATDVKVTIDNADGGTLGWVNVGIREIEVYDSIQAEQISLESIANTIEPYTITKDDTKLQLPAVPEGYSIKINGADLEQIIADDGTIYHPYENKNVNVSFEIKNESTLETYVTNDFVYTVEAKDIIAELGLEAVGEKQAKPTVIPEIQEWASLGEATIDFAKYNSINIKGNDGAEAVVDAFAKDYEVYTATKMTVVSTDTETAFKIEKVDKDYLGKEGYELIISDEMIKIEYVEVAGLNYALQTLLQMNELYDGKLPCGVIRDYPRYEVRGILLDIARKPISLEMCEALAKTMRYYKMNDLQIHLSDNYIFLENYGKGENENKAFEAYEAYRLESSLTNAKGESPTAKRLLYF